MESAKPTVYTQSNAEGMERVKKEDGAYAFFMEGAAIEYNMAKSCDLTQIGNLLDSKGYGIALPPGTRTKADLPANLFPEPFCCTSSDERLLFTFFLLT